MVIDSIMRKIIYKKTIAILLLVSLVFTCAACGKNDAASNNTDSMGDNADTSDTIEGDLQDIMAEIYSGIEGIDSETKEAIEGYITDVLTEDNEQALLGTADIEYNEGIYSVPMISSIAYQCVLLRVNPDNIEEVKQQLKDNADLNKWVCVSAETMLVENTGDLVLFIMSEKDVAYAIVNSFQSLK